MAGSKKRIYENKKKLLLFLNGVGLSKINFGIIRFYPLLTGTDTRVIIFLNISDR
jgi:hypothetical protein